MSLKGFALSTLFWFLLFVITGCAPIGLGKIGAIGLGIVPAIEIKTLNPINLWGNDEKTTSKSRKK